ncbi:DUF937 domain-containing protein [Phormidium sp. CLA17]|uniref:DUF937 domain-containing protein n=1 Tax=Leptolyngbya sp. Cla-17 TaxID=2803751 RepID=UPI0014932258|nr:DUF937 domain-containing protein [Leptolyngbya sp. Cla-17]MBM0743881.1 DUF937 domain-containing protein [Leptolyngbya sp. Cla-17]
MGLFFDVLSAVNNPNQQASIDGLSSMSSAVQQLASKNGLDAAATQSLLSAAGSALRPVLQQQAAAVGGASQLAGMISQFAGANGGMMGQASSGNFSLSALQSIIPAEMQQQLINSISQKTGMNTGMVQTVLPSVLPIVMNFFNMGAPAPGSRGGNLLLSAFLDSARDGDTDLGDVMKFAGRFLNAPHQ